MNTAARPKSGDTTLQCSSTGTVAPALSVVSVEKHFSCFGNRSFEARAEPSLVSPTTPSLLEKKSRNSAELVERTHEGLRTEAATPQSLVLHPT